MKKIDDINEYKQIVLNILVKVDRICKDNNLKYFLNYGTLIGAIRHKGFIPWDDDIDISMPREDYDRLASIIDKTPDADLNFIRIETNKDSIYPFGKICDTNTVLFEEGYKQVKGYGAFIDVFPFYYMNEDPHIRDRIAKKIGRHYLYAQVASMKKIDNHTDSLYTNIKRTIIFYLTRVLDSKRLVEKVNSECKKYGREKTSLIGSQLSIPITVMDADSFENTISVEFEGFLFRAPACYDELLTSLYGDWKEPPQEDERKTRHTLECYIKE